MNPLFRNIVDKEIIIIKVVSSNGLKYKNLLSKAKTEGNQSPIQEHNGQGNNIVNYNNLPMPISVSPYKIKSAIDLIHNKIDVLFEDNEDFVLSAKKRIEYKDKNKITGMTIEYFNTRIKPHLHLEKELDEFLKNNSNQKEKTKYINIVRDINSKFIAYSNQFSNFDEAFEQMLTKNDIKKFYEQIKIYFNENLVKNYQEVIDFNKAVTEERNTLLNELLVEYSGKYEKNCKELKEMNEKRQNITKYIKENEMMEKFKILQNDIIDLKTDIATQKEKLESLNKENTIAKELKEKLNEKEKLDLSMNKYLDNNPIFEVEKEIFNKVIKEVLGDIGLLDIKLNTNKNPDFISEIIDKDSKNISAKDEGTSFKKLMCCSFDLALLVTYASYRYYHFVYHDGIFDGLDNRQKDNYLNIVGEFCDLYNIQYIFTSIEDELPPMISGVKNIDFFRKEGIIVKELSDVGDEGRLFKMPAF